jgi:hypothetical protein
MRKFGKAEVAEAWHRRVDRRNIKMQCGLFFYRNVMHTAPHTPHPKLSGRYGQSERSHWLFPWCAALYRWPF